MFLKYKILSALFFIFYIAAVVALMLTPKDYNIEKVDIKTERVYEENLKNYSNFINYNTEYKEKESVLSRPSLYFGILYYRLYTQTQEKAFLDMAKKLIKKEFDGPVASEAFLEMGYLMEEEEGDVKKAEEFLKKSASLGNSGASFLLSEYGNQNLVAKSSHMATTYYDTNEKIKKENEKLLRWLEVSGYIQNNSFAAYNYGWYLLRNGEENKGVEQLEYASESGNSYASMVLGDAYYNGKYIGQNFDKALNYYLLSTRQRNPISAYKAGKMLSVGFGGVEKNIEIANDLFLYSSSKGYPKAQYELALNIYKNKNEDNYTKMFTLLESASERGNVDAAKLLADFYTYGVNTEKNHEKAVTLYGIAANAYDWDAIYKFSVLIEHENLFLGDENKEEIYKGLKNTAFKYQVIGSGLGIPYSQFELATKYYENKDWLSTQYLAEKSSMQGVLDAKRLLAYLPEVEFLYKNYVKMKDKGFSDEEMVHSLNIIMSKVMLPQRVKK